MATYTANYGLHQWEASDNFLRTDFNTDFGIIDGALGEKAEVVTGSYTGDGQSTRTISLGFTPRAVLVTREDGATTYQNGNYQIFGGLAVTGHPLQRNSLVIVTGGFQVRYAGYPDDVYTNSNGQEYRYIAIQ